MATQSDFTARCLAVLHEQAETRSSIENPLVPLNAMMILNSGGVGMGGGSTQFGVVTTEVALQFSAVYACVRIIAEAIASVPCILNQATDKGKRRATDHYLYPIMHDEPNDWMTAFVWFESLMASTLATGNGYSYLERRNDGTVANALLLDSGKIEPVIVDGQKKYSYRLKQNILLDDADVIHVTGLSFNGLVGLSPIH